MSCQWGVEFPLCAPRRGAGQALLVQAGLGDFGKGGAPRRGGGRPISRRPPETGRSPHDSGSHGSVSGGGEPAEDDQALADLSEGEADLTRPGEDDEDATREEGREGGREELRYGAIDQGELCRSAWGCRFLEPLKVFRELWAPAVQGGLSSNRISFI